MNFAFEELRQVDFSCYKIKQVPFLHFFCSFALRFYGCVAVVQTSFSALRFEYQKPIFFVLLLFRRLIFSKSALTFSHRTLLHSAQLLLFLQQIIFSLIDALGQTLEHIP